MLAYSSIRNKIMNNIECNICGGREFIEFKNRGKIRCSDCRSIERTRIFWMYLEKFAHLQNGMQVLHFAPENAVSEKIYKLVGNGYDALDLNPARYSFNGTRQFNLCEEVESLESDKYDLILHNHVLEHLPCNITAVLWHMHRSLKRDGLHMFSIPLTGGNYDEHLGNLEKQDAIARFGQHDHVRNFGQNDINKSLGMVFNIDSLLKKTLAVRFPRSKLRCYNIPKNRWHTFNGATMFLLRKHHLKLQSQ